MPDAHVHCFCLFCSSVLLQTPKEEDRAEPYRPAAALLVTGDDPATAANLTAGLLPKPSLRPAGLLSLQRYLEGFSADMGPDGGAVPAEFLSLLGLRLGTSSRIQAGLYLETALVGVSGARGGWGCMGQTVAWRFVLRSGWVLQQQQQQLSVPGGSSGRGGGCGVPSG
jgi:hypothetical protein